MPPVVALLDISGSMSQHTRLFVSSMPSPMPVVHLPIRTRLTNVAGTQGKDPMRLARLASASTGRAARGSPPLAAFNKQWSRRVLTQGAVVLLFTDGLERDPDERLGFEIDRLPVLPAADWLNPPLRFSLTEARPWY
jgi:uncharacterized protein with von Willebrand factor type A (vWA) domain